MPIKKRKPTEFWVKKNTFLLMESERKDLLVRSENHIFPRAVVGQVVHVCSQIAGKERHLVRLVVARRPFPTMIAILEHVDLDRLAHGTKVQAMSYLARIYSCEQEEAEAVVYEFKTVEESTHHD